MLGSATHFLVVFVVISLKPLDIAFLRAIHTKVNIVPVIAKADTLTKSELTTLKHTVRLLSLSPFAGVCMYNCVCVIDCIS